MNKIIPLIALAMVLTQALHAQIKRQYKDEKFAKETVVVKEDAAQSDMDILNSQFDLDDIAVGEVIRITTETMPVQASQTIDPIEEETVALVTIDQEIEIEIEEVIEIEEEIDIEEVVKEEIIEEEKAPTMKTSVRSMGSSAKKIKSKRRNPKFKKKKRKRKRSKSNRWKNKCYRF